MLSYIYLKNIVQHFENIEEHMVIKHCRCWKNVTTHRITTDNIWGKSTIQSAVLYEFG